ncbi:hypothetical protein DOTSEDRAFT_79711 [Dothistroma septosporum NZE10]|uniref:Uncharacterized protein n=1 Tax=Dothistroma septosporum (strain NZE10 / CBS 128990) TaxID=675120 RepID=N1PTX1_DOTSN|nr:hypothetical protein DOTSEDRAFT_79711 [Dothistroma septosporum NZE10]
MPDVQDWLEQLQQLLQTASNDFDNEHNDMIHTLLSQLEANDDGSTAKIAELEALIKSKDTELTVCRSWKEVCMETLEETDIPQPLHSVTSSTVYAWLMNTQVMDKIQASTGKVKISMQELALKKKELGGTDMQLSKSRREVEDLRKVIVTKEHDLEADAKLLSTLSNQSEQLDWDLQTKTKSLTARQSIVDQRQKDLDHLIQKGKGQQTMINNLKKEYEEQCTSINAKSQEKRRLEEAIGRIKREIGEAGLTVIALRKQVSLDVDSAKAAQADFNAIREDIQDRCDTFGVKLVCEAGITVTSFLKCVADQLLDQSVRLKRHGEQQSVDITTLQRRNFKLVADLTQREHDCSAGEERLRLFEKAAVADQARLRKEHEETQTSLNSRWSIKYSQAKSDLTTAHNTAIEVRRTAHNTVMEELRTEHNTATKELRMEHNTVMEELRTAHEAAMEELRTKHIQATTNVQDRLRSELEEAHSRTKADLQNSHQDELTMIGEEYRQAQSRANDDWVRKLEEARASTKAALEEVHNAEIQSLREQHSQAEASANQALHTKLEEARASTKTTLEGAHKVEIEHLRKQHSEAEARTKQAAELKLEEVRASTKTILEGAHKVEIEHLRKQHSEAEARTKQAAELKLEEACTETTASLEKAHKVELQHLREQYSQAEARTNQAAELKLGEACTETKASLEKAHKVELQHLREQHSQAEASLETELAARYQRKLEQAQSDHEIAKEALVHECTKKLNDFAASHQATEKELAQQWEWKLEQAQSDHEIAKEALVHEWTKELNDFAASHQATEKELAQQWERKLNKAHTDHKTTKEALVHEWTKKLKDSAASHQATKQELAQQWQRKLNEAHTGHETTHEALVHEWTKKLNDSAASHQATKQELAQQWQGKLNEAHTGHQAVKKKLIQHWESKLNDANASHKTKEAKLEQIWERKLNEANTGHQEAKKKLTQEWESTLNGANAKFKSNGEKLVQEWRAKLRKEEHDNDAAAEKREEQWHTAWNKLRSQHQEAKDNINQELNDARTAADTQKKDLEQKIERNLATYRDELRDLRQAAIEKEQQTRSILQQEYDGKLKKSQAGMQQEVQQLKTSVTKAKASQAAHSKLQTLLLDVFFENSEGMSKDEAKKNHTDVAKLQDLQVQLTEYRDMTLKMQDVCKRFAGIKDENDMLWETLTAACTEFFLLADLTDQMLVYWDSGRPEVALEARRRLNEWEKQKQEYAARNTVGGGSSKRPRSPTHVDTPRQRARTDGDVDV